MTKKFLTIGALVLGVTLGWLSMPEVEGQYGGYTTRAPKYTTANLPTCSAAVNAGQLAWDTTSVSLKVCDGSSFVETGTFGAASTLEGLTDVTITAAASGDFLFHNGSAWVDQTTAQIITQLGVPTIGTANTIAKFNSGATDLADSSFTDDGTDVTLDTTVDLVIPDSTGSTDGAVAFGTGEDFKVYYDTVGAHGGGAAMVFHSLGAVTEDYLFFLNAGNAATFFIFDTSVQNSLRYTPGTTTAAGSDFLELDITGVADPGANIFNVLSIDWNDVEWTVAAATLNAINVQSITADASATSNLFTMGTGWDTLIESASFDVLGTFVDNASSQAAVEISGTAPDSDGADVFDYLRITPTIPTTMNASARVTGIKIESMAASTGTSSAIFVDMDAGGAASWDNMLECNGGFNADCQWLSASGEDISLNAGGGIDIDAAEAVAIDAAAGNWNATIASGNQFNFTFGGSDTPGALLGEGATTPNSIGLFRIFQGNAVTQDGSDDFVVLRVATTQTTSSSGSGNDHVAIDIQETATNDPQTESTGLRLGDNIDYLLMIDEAIGTNDATTATDKTSAHTVAPSGMIAIEIAGTLYWIPFFPN